MKVRSQERFESYNELMDEVVPKLSNAEAVLLLFYFRHARMKGRGDQRRNVFTVGDGRAGKMLGKARQTIYKLRISMAQKEVIAPVKLSSGRTIWVIGSSPVPPEEGQGKG